MAYNKIERNALRSLFYRARFLKGKLHTVRKDDAKVATFRAVQAELAALRWAIHMIVKARGSLPDEYDKMRQNIWPLDNIVPEEIGG